MLPLMPLLALLLLLPLLTLSAATPVVGLEGGNAVLLKTRKSVLFSQIDRAIIVRLQWIIVYQEQTLIAAA